MRHFVRNWPEYESGLRNRGILTLWVAPQAMQLWPAQARSTLGGQSIYSNQAIQTSLMLRLVFGEALRQTEGLMRSQIDVIIAPRVTAQPSAQFEAAPTTRDNHLLMIQSLGRLEWQEAYGYGKRALVETTMGRFKAIIGPKLRARDPHGQQAEANAAVAVLNRMLSAGRPNSVRTSAAAV